MAETALLFGERQWFHDRRTPVRRMSVSSHPDQGLVVISLWQGDICTGTFRLPRTDLARFICALAEAGEA